MCLQRCALPRLDTRSFICPSGNARHKCAGTLRSTGLTLSCALLHVPFSLLVLAKIAGVGIELLSVTIEAVGIIAALCWPHVNVECPVPVLPAQQAAICVRTNGCAYECRARRCMHATQDARKTSEAWQKFRGAEGTDTCEPRRKLCACSLRSSPCFGPTFPEARNLARALGTGTFGRATRATRKFCAAALSLRSSPAMKAQARKLEPFGVQ